MAIGFANFVLGFGFGFAMIFLSHLFGFFVFCPCKSIIDSQRQNLRREEIEIMGCGRLLVFNWNLIGSLSYDAKLLLRCEKFHLFTVLVSDCVIIVPFLWNIL